MRGTVAYGNLRLMQVHGAVSPLPSNRIGQLRRQQGLRLAKVAAALDVDQSTVSRWERGGGISDDQKFALAELLGVDVPYLMGWTEVAA